jgi:hypothetical protein
MDNPIGIILTSMVIIYFQLLEIVYVKTNFNIFNYKISTKIA